MGMTTKREGEGPAILAVAKGFIALSHSCHKLMPEWINRLISRVSILAYELLGTNEKTYAHIKQIWLA